MVSSLRMCLKSASYVGIPKKLDERGVWVILCLVFGTRGVWIMYVCILFTQEQVDTR
jgi:hypothetical protein